jgi:hypothetical protein
MVDAFTKSGATLDFNQLSGVGLDLGKAILAVVPPEAQSAVATFIPQIVQGIHEAFALAITQTFWVGIVGAILAALAASTMHEHALRTSHGPATVPVGEPAEGGNAKSTGGFVPEPARIERTSAGD